VYRFASPGLVDYADQYHDTYGDDEPDDCSKYHDYAEYDDVEGAEKHDDENWGE
jgi:hypothetical protein